MINSFFDAKYFLRSDMHLFVELLNSNTEKQVNQWWQEHQLQKKYFYNQVTKIEKEVFVERNLKNTKLRTELTSFVTKIGTDYEKTINSLFSSLKVFKAEELKIIKQLNIVSDSIKRRQLVNELNDIKKTCADLNTEIMQKGLLIISELDKYKGYVKQEIMQNITDEQILYNRLNVIFIVIIIISIVFSVFMVFYISKLISKPVNKILRHVRLLGKGMHPELLNVTLNDEFGKIQESLNTLTELLVKTSDFSKEIGQGNFDSNFTPVSNDDVLGNSLLQMRNSLKKAREEEDIRRIEDERNAWMANGLTKFGDIMRQSGGSIKTLGYNIISGLIDYLGAVQGALFVIDDENSDDVYFELISAIAYGRDKFMKKQIREGEGLVGRVAFEQKTIYLKEIPKDYVSITSGLGDANPDVILLVPVKLDNKVNGVIELISFTEFEQYQIEFVEKVGENIASFIATIKINEKTAALLAESKYKSEELAAQEEEMRQNMEELQATQEEATRREEERTILWDAIGQVVGIVETDLAGTILNVNNKTIKMLNVSSGELNSKDYKSVFFSNSDYINDKWLEVVKEKHVSIASNWKHNNIDIQLSHDLTLVKDTQGNNQKILILISQKSS